jgi:dihydrofolate reductase
MSNILSVSVAVDLDGGIGKDKKIPWDFRQTEQQLFKQRTMGHYVLIGQTTWDNMKASLKGRNVIVITDDQAYVSPKPLFAIAHSIPEALSFIARIPDTEVFILGGASIFAQMIGRAQKIYKTTIQARYGCDTFFPHMNAMDWRLISSKEYKDEDPMYVIEEWERR